MSDARHDPAVAGEAPEGPGAVLVAGAGPGVSGHLARLYAAEGHPLVLLGSDPFALAELADSCRTLGVETVTAAVNLTDAAATSAAVTEGARRFSWLRVVHFNPSAYREEDPLTLTPAGLLADVALGVGALLTVVQAAVPHLRAGSRISVTGSMAADSPWHGAASLGVQKAGVRNLVHSIDATLRERGVRAVSVTVRGMLAAEGPLSHGAVARSLRAAVDQAEDDWRTELDHPAAT